jgi:spore germination protein GerM
MRKGSVIIIVLVILVTLLGVGIGLFYYYNNSYEPERPGRGKDIGESILKEYITLKIFYAAGSQLELTEKKVPATLSTINLADILIKEFLKVSRKSDYSILPDDAKIKNIFISPDGILYIDFSREFQRNFKGDIVDEYMLLKSIFDTAIGNLDILDVMILVDGKEVESIGGHFIINQPLKKVLTQEIRVEEPGSE